jgi:hypothetical protein
MPGRVPNLRGAIPDGSWENPKTFAKSYSSNKSSGMWAACFTGIGLEGDDSISVSPPDGIAGNNRRRHVFFVLKVSLHDIAGDLTTSPVFEELKIPFDAIVFDLMGPGSVLHKLKVFSDLVSQGPQASGAFFGLQIAVHPGGLNPKGVLIAWCGSLRKLDISTHEGPPSHDQGAGPFALHIAAHNRLLPKVHQIGVEGLHIPIYLRAVGNQGGTASNQNIPLDDGAVQGGRSISWDFDGVVNGDVANQAAGLHIARVGLTRKK